MKNKICLFCAGIFFFVTSLEAISTVIFDNQTNETLSLNLSQPFSIPAGQISLQLGKMTVTTDASQFGIFKENPNFAIRAAAGPFNYAGGDGANPLSIMVVDWTNLSDGYTYTLTAKDGKYQMTARDLRKEVPSFVAKCSDLTDGIACINEIINASAAYKDDSKNIAKQIRIQAALWAYCDYRNLARNVSGAAISEDIKSFQTFMYDQRSWYFANKCVPQLTEHKKNCDYLKNAADKIAKISETSKAAAKDKAKQLDFLNALTAYCDFRGIPKNTPSFIIITDIEAFQVFIMENRSLYRTCFQLTEHKQNCDYIKDVAEKIKKISEASKAFNAAKTDTSKQQDLANAMKAYREFRGIVATIPDCVVIADIEVFCAFAKQNEAWLKENCTGILGQIMAIAEKALDFGKDVGQKGLDVTQDVLSAVGLGDATNAVINALPNPAIAVDFAFNAATGAISTAADIAQKGVDLGKKASETVVDTGKKVADNVKKVFCGIFGC